MVKTQGVKNHKFVDSKAGNKNLYLTLAASLLTLVILGGYYFYSNSAVEAAYSKAYDLDRGAGRDFQDALKSAEKANKKSLVIVGGEWWP